MEPLRLLSLTFSQLQHKQQFSLQLPLCIIGRHAAQQLQSSCGGDIHPVKTTEMHAQEPRQVQPTRTVEDASRVTEQRNVTQLCELPMS